METELNEIRVIYVGSPNGPAGSGEAFDKLTSRLVTRKSQRELLCWMPLQG